MDRLSPSKLCTAANVLHGAQPAGTARPPHGRVENQDLIIKLIIKLFDHLSSLEASYRHSREGVGTQAGAAAGGATRSSALMPSTECMPAAAAAGAWVVAMQGSSLPVESSSQGIGAQPLHPAVLCACRPDHGAL